MQQQQLHRRCVKAIGDATQGMCRSEVAHHEVPMPINGSKSYAVTEGLCRVTVPLKQCDSHQWSRCATSYVIG